MKSNILTTLIITFVFLFQIQTSSAQMSAPGSSPTLPDLGNLNSKAKTLAKPIDPFSVYGNLSGEVKVKITVDEKGKVINAEAVSGDERLRFTSVMAAEESKFEPYLVKGKAVKFSGFLVFNFGTPKINTEDKELTDKDKAFLNELSKFLEDPEKENHEKAQKLYDKGDYLGVVKLLVLDGETKYDTVGLELRARANLKLNKYDEALSDINRAMDFTLFKFAYQYELRGDIYKAKYSNVMAEKDYRKALELAPNNESIKQKLSSLSGQQVGNITAIESFQRDLKASLTEFNRLKADYEKKGTAFNQLLEEEKKKSQVNVTGLCQSLLAVKTEWKRLDPVVKKITDKIGDLQNRGKVDEYFEGATLELVQTSEIITWLGKTYLPEKEKYVFLFDKLGCKALEKP